MNQKSHICCDLKSFYASVECVECSLDPLTTNLVVADKRRTEKTICLAVSPSLKAYGIPGRARHLFLCPLVLLPFYWQSLLICVLFCKMLDTMSNIFPSTRMQRPPPAWVLGEFQAFLRCLFGTPGLAALGIVSPVSARILTSVGYLKWQ